MTRRYTDEELDSLELTELCDPDRMEDRRVHAPEDALRELFEKEVDVMRQSLRRILEGVAVYSQHQADYYLMFANDLAEEVPKNYANYGTRVRLRDNTLALTWHTHAFTKSKKWYARDMRRGIGESKVPMRYNMKQFSKAEGEELREIRRIEAKYELARYVLETHRKVRTNLAELEGRVIKMVDQKLE